MDRYRDEDGYLDFELLLKDYSICEIMDDPELCEGLPGIFFERDIADMFGARPLLFRKWLVWDGLATVGKKHRLVGTQKALDLNLIMHLNQHAAFTLEGLLYIRYALELLERKLPTMYNKLKGVKE